MLADHGDTRDGSRDVPARRWISRGLLLAGTAVAVIFLAAIFQTLTVPLVLNGSEGESGLQVCPSAFTSLTSGASVDFSDRACGDYTGSMLARSAWFLLGATTSGALTAFFLIRGRSRAEARRA